jgi:hypothetical protein
LLASLKRIQPRLASVPLIWIGIEILWTGWEALNNIH